MSDHPHLENGERLDGSDGRTDTPPCTIESKRSMTNFKTMSGNEA